MKLFFALWVLASAAAAQSNVPTSFPPMAKMRSLAGTWRGEVVNSPVEKEKGARVIYESVSGGQAVMERLLMGTDESTEMVSMYHQQGDQLMMTHYCSSNTQPRLRTNGYPRDLSEFKFDFVDSTNILKANWMNIVSLTLQFPEKDRLRQTWRSHDSRERPVVLELRRVR